MWTARLGSLALLAVLTVTGCAGDDTATGTVDGTTGTTADEFGATGEADDDADDRAGDDDTGDDTADEGDGDADAAAGGDDFPIPAPDGLLLDALADAGLQMTGQRQLYYPNDELERLVAFYDDWTGQDGEWSKGEAEGTVVWQRLDGDGIQQITVTPDHDPGAQADGPVAFVLLVASG